MTAHVDARGEDQMSPGHGHANGSDHAAVVAALAEQLRCAMHEEQEHCYTLHLDFAAENSMTARALAVALAEGLGTLCPTVQTYSAFLSAGGSWADPEAVFCMADGPDGAFCAVIAGHVGQHAGAGPAGQRWGHADGGGTTG
jgi:hypothetical protein